MISVISLLTGYLQASPPWLSPYASLAHKVVNAASESVADALNQANRDLDAGVRFVEQSALLAGEPYESFIYRTRKVPTRDNLHDLFNGLMWLTYPHTKRRLNQLQAEQIAQNGTTGPRGAVRDALTLFDENAAVLQAPTALIDALRRRDWKTLFVDQRQLWESARLVVFGHALMEKLMQPRKAITAHVWLIEELNDSALTSSLTVDQLSAKRFLPLPVLGVPGWWDANEDPAFYDDAEVFRPAR